MKKQILILAALFCSSFFLPAQEKLSSDATISLITTSPWSGAIYSVYGHTALYVKDDSAGVDQVFNYGYFDTQKPFFIYHFMRADADYVLGALPFDYFLKEYEEKGLEVVEQELNLTRQEKQNLWEALFVNAKPENREYRYNFLFDNCSTRPRDMVERYVDGHVEYPADTRRQTFRDLIHECVRPYPWMEFGIDLIIGSGADSTINLREKMFLPIYLMHTFDGAGIVKNDTLRYDLVIDKRIVLEAANENGGAGGGSPGILSPLAVSCAILLLSVFVSAIQCIKLNRTIIPRIYDTVLFAIAGAGGFVIFFLMFFSEHPVVTPNWNLVWMNVLSLIFAVLFWAKSLRNVVYFYHFINFAVLMLFLVFWWLIPQNLPFASIPLALSLCLRSGVNVLIRGKVRRSENRFTSSRHMKAGWGQYNS